MQVLLCGKLLLSPFQNLFSGGGKSKPFSASSAFGVRGGICSSIPLWSVYCTHGGGDPTFMPPLTPHPKGEEEGEGEKIHSHTLRKGERIKTLLAGKVTQRLRQEKSE